MSAKRKATKWKKQVPLGNWEKKSLVGEAAAEVLAVRPDLTMVQLRRVFSYGYRLLWRKKGGEELHRTAFLKAANRRRVRTEMEAVMKEARP